MTSQTQTDTFDSIRQALEPSHTQVDKTHIAPHYDALLADKQLTHMPANASDHLAYQPQYQHTTPSSYLYLQIERMDSHDHYAFQGTVLGLAQPRANHIKINFDHLYQHEADLVERHETGHIKEPHLDEWQIRFKYGPLWSLSTAY